MNRHDQDYSRRGRGRDEWGDRQSGGQYSEENRDEQGYAGNYGFQEGSETGRTAGGDDRQPYSQNPYGRYPGQSREGRESREGSSRFGRREPYQERYGGGSEDYYGRSQSGSQRGGSGSQGSWGESQWDRGGRSSQYESESQYRGGQYGDESRYGRQQHGGSGQQYGSESQYGGSFGGDYGRGGGQQYGGSGQPYGSESQYGGSYGGGYGRGERELGSSRGGHEADWGGSYRGVSEWSGGRSEGRFSGRGGGESRGGSRGWSGGREGRESGFGGGREGGESRWGGGRESGGYGGRESGWSGGRGGGGESWGSGRGERVYGGERGGRGQYGSSGQFGEYGEYGQYGMDRGGQSGSQSSYGAGYSSSRDQWRGQRGGSEPGYGAGLESRFGSIDRLSEGPFADRDDTPGYFGTGYYGDGGSSHTGGYDQRWAQRNQDRMASSQRSGGWGSWEGQQQQRRYRTGPKGYTRSDDRLCEDISERLMMADNIDSSEVSVNVKDGQVTLEGTVRDRRMKHAIEDLVEACPGVQDVNNRIRVTREEASTSSTTGQSTTGQSQTSQATGAGQRSALTTSGTTSPTSGTSTSASQASASGATNGGKTRKE